MMSSPSEDSYTAKRGELPEAGSRAKDDQNVSKTSNETTVYVLSAAVLEPEEGFEPSTFRLRVPLRASGRVEAVLS